MSDPVIPDPLRAGVEALLVDLHLLRPALPSISNGPGKHERARDRREVETIHKTLNVVEAEVAALLRRVPPAAPETDAVLQAEGGADALIRALRDILAEWRATAGRDATKAARRDYHPDDKQVYHVEAQTLQACADELAAVLDRPAPPQEETPHD